MPRLRLDPHNARLHPERNKAMIRQSLEEVGAGRSILVGGEGHIIAGNGVYEQAQALGLKVREVEAAPDELIAVVRQDLVGDAAVRAALLDNAAGETSTWDMEALRQLDADMPNILAGLDEVQAELAAALAAQLPEPGAGGDDYDATPDEGPTRAQLGDLWIIGGVHRLLVGDCTDPANVARLMQVERADAVVTDPPYAFGLASTSELNSKSGGWADMMNNASWYADQYRQWAKIAPNGPIWCCINWRTIPILMKASIDAGVSMESLMVWHKDWIGPGGTRGLRPSYELIALTLTGSYGIPNRGVPDMITVPVSSHKEHGHKAEKPIDLFIRLIEISDASLVFDGFLGSGTTLIAAHRTGRRCYGMEIEPRYADVILRRAEAEGLTVERAP